MKWALLATCGLAVLSCVPAPARIEAYGAANKHKLAISEGEAWIAQNPRHPKTPKIRRVVVAAAFARAERKNTLSGWQSFIRKYQRYPRMGQYMRRARTEEVKLAFRRATKRATVQGWARYKARYGSWAEAKPFSKRANAAQALCAFKKLKLISISETALWMRFIETYPKSVEADKARARLCARAYSVAVGKNVSSRWQHFVAETKSWNWECEQALRLKRASMISEFRQLIQAGNAAELVTFKAKYPEIESFKQFSFLERAVELRERCDLSPSQTAGSFKAFIDGVERLGMRSSSSPISSSSRKAKRARYQANPFEVNGKSQDWEAVLQTVYAQIVKHADSAKCCKAYAEVEMQTKSASNAHSESVLAVAEHQVMELEVAKTCGKLFNRDTSASTLERFVEQYESVSELSEQRRNAMTLLAKFHHPKETKAQEAWLGNSRLISKILKTYEKSRKMKRSTSAQKEAMRRAVKRALAQINAQYRGKRVRFANAEVKEVKATTVMSAVGRRKLRRLRRVMGGGTSGAALAEFSLTFCKECRQPTGTYEVSYHFKQPSLRWFKDGHSPKNTHFRDVKYAPEGLARRPDGLKWTYVSRGYWVLAPKDANFQEVQVRDVRRIELRDVTIVKERVGKRSALSYSKGDIHTLEGRIVRISANGWNDSDIEIVIR